MANKRVLKKEIRNMCGDLAAECVMAVRFVPDIDVAVMDDIIGKIADLQEISLSKCSVVFDKAEREFADRKEFRKAKSSYFRKNFHALIANFNQCVEGIVKEMNAALPAAQKEANKKLMAD